MSLILPSTWVEAESEPVDPVPSWVAYLTNRDMRRRSLSSASGPGLEKTLTLPISEASLRGLARLFCPFLSSISVYSIGAAARRRWPLRSPHRLFRSSRCAVSASLVSALTGGNFVSGRRLGQGEVAGGGWR